MGDRCNGFIWLVLVLVQDIIDIKSDDTLRVAILQQKPLSSSRADFNNGAVERIRKHREVNVRIRLILHLRDLNHWVQICTMSVQRSPVQCGPNLTPLFSGPTLSYVTVTCNLVPRASVTLVQRNGKTKTAGKIHLNLGFHWPLTERAQFHQKLINKRRTMILLPDFQYSKHPHIRTHDFGVQADRVLI